VEVTEMIKFPKTPRVSKGIPQEWMKLQAVIMEKVDGANSAISFDNSKIALPAISLTDSRLVLQSRGHFLTGGARERLFERMWPWAYERLADLRDLLGDRYILFGEWVYAKNRIWYDALPDYFLAFDMWDKEEECFLSSELWLPKLPGSIHSVAVLYKGRLDKAGAIGSYIGPSKYKTSDWHQNLKDVLDTPDGLHYSDTETEWTNLMEGVYVKVEDDGKVVGRLKLPRSEFEKVRTDDSKWGRRPLLPNQLK
jgi:hypothetical protein